MKVTPKVRMKRKTYMQDHRIMQVFDADGVVRELEAYLQGTPSVAKKRLPLVFPLDRCESNTNVWT
jgi:hypothetical protein